MIPIVQNAHTESRGTYGARRIAAEVVSQGYSCGRYKAKTLMNIANVVAKQKKNLK